MRHVWIIELLSDDGKWRILPTGTSTETGLFFWRHSDAHAERTRRIEGGQDKDMIRVARYERKSTAVYERDLPK